MGKRTALKVYARTLERKEGRVRGGGVTGRKLQQFGFRQSAVNVNARREVVIWMRGISAGRFSDRFRGLKFDQTRPTVKSIWY